MENRNGTSSGHGEVEWEIGNEVGETMGNERGSGGMEWGSWRTRREGGEKEYGTATKLET